MNKTIQSNSYRSYSPSLLDKFKKHFTDSGLAEKNFLFRNLDQCLNDFGMFTIKFKERAEELKQLDKMFNAIQKNTNDARNYDLWLDEKISKALDVYWAPLSQAATQYTSPAYAGYLERLIALKPQIEDYLKKIYQLARTTLETEITINDILLFFDELTLIRLAPYTRTALIGIPFRVVEPDSAPRSESSLEPAPSDDGVLAGIAHELGHFLYWRLGKFDQIDLKHQDVLEQMSELLKKRRHNQDEREIRFIRAWFEELFADFIGAKIAGDTYVRSCKEMVKRNNRSIEQLVENDQQHVVDILRPLVCMYAIDQNRDESLASWRQFFREEFPVSLGSNDIEGKRENEDQRDIRRKPEELSQILMDTLDILNEQIGLASNNFLHANFSEIASGAQLIDKANRLEVQQREKPIEGSDLPTALDIFLEPSMLEAGGQKHEHTWTAASPHSHTVRYSHSH